MSWSNLGSNNLGGSPVVVYSIDGGTNFRWATLDGETALTGLTNYTNPTLAIEAALAWLGTQGGGLCTLRGPGERWTLETTIDSQADGLILLGGGLGSPELYLGNGLDVNLIDNVHNFTRYTRLDLNGNWTNQTRDAGASENAVTRGVANVGGDSVMVDNCYIHEMARHGINFGDCEGGWAHHNLVWDIGWNGIFSWRLPGIGMGADIHDNEVYNCGDIGIGCYGSRTNIHHNYIHDILGSFGSGNTRWGAGIEGGDWNKINDNIIDDVLQGIATGTVGAEDPQHWEICRNTISGLTDAAGGGSGITIKARHGKCESNTILDIPDWTGNFNAGIRVQSSANHVSFAKNEFYGITDYVGYDIATGTDDVTVDGPKFHILTGLPYSGIRWEGACHRLQLLNGRMWGCVDDVNKRGGITANNNTAQCDDIVIKGWYFYNLPRTAIDIQDSDDLNVLNTRFLDCLLGLDISHANSVRTFLDGCDFTDSTDAVSSAGSTNPRWGTNKDHNGALVVGAEP